MRANYNVSRNVRRKIVTELYQYYENLKQLEKITATTEQELDIIDSTPERDETGIRSQNQVGKPTEVKAIKLAEMSTRAMIEASRRISYVSEAMKRLSKDEQEVVDYIFRDKLSQKQAETRHYISPDSYYNTKNKIIYLTAVEYGDIF